MLWQWLIDLIYPPSVIPIICLLTWFALTGLKRVPQDWRPWARHNFHYNQSACMLLLFSNLILKSLSKKLEEAHKVDMQL